MRWAFIGVGVRRFGHLSTILQLQNARITAVSDTYEPNVQRAVELGRDKTRSTPFSVGPGSYDWRRVIERDDVDAVVVSSAWEQHAPMVVAAMQAGKYAFLEVPPMLCGQQTLKIAASA